MTSTRNIRSKPRPTAARRPKPDPKAQNRATWRWVFGFAALFASLYVLLSVGSFFFNWKADQSLLNDWSAREEIENFGGMPGAHLGNLIVADGFGVFGLLIPVVLAVLSLRLLRFRPVILQRSVVISLLTMFLGSVTLGYIGGFSDGPGAFGTGLGGAQGIFVAKWLEGYLSFGTALLLVVLIVCLAVYINRSTITLLNRMGRGVADKTASVAEGVTGYLRPRHDERVAEESPEANLPAAEDEDKPARRGWWSRLTGAGAERETLPEAWADDAPAPDLDYNYADDAVEPLAPIAPPPIQRKFVPEAALDDDFIVRTAGEEPARDPARREPPRVPLTDRLPDGCRYREFTDADGFIVREVIRDMDDVLDVLDEAGDAPRPAPAEPEPDVPTPGDTEEMTVGVRIDENFTVEKTREAETLPDELIDTGFYDHTLDLSSYQKPPVELMEDHRIEVEVTDAELRENKNKIIETLENFGIRIESIKATVGPTVTLYEIVPAPGVRISRIRNLENDIALSLAALGIRIIAPIPGKGTIGIEVPNKDKQIVSMYSAVKSVRFQEAGYDLPVVLGRTIQNENYVIDLARMPHLLVAGATGQGKSVGLNAIITSLLYKKHPSEVKFVMVDPKKVELTLYAKLERHFLAMMGSEDEPIITDTQKVVYTLNSLCVEMDSRYDLLKNAGVRNLKEYNAKFAARRLNPNNGHRYLPYIVVVIDEYADLLVTAGREIETPLARIAQLARAVGIHLIIATQRPTADVITGLIKANIPARVAFRVTSMMNSRTILDHPGAEQLIGRGDMLVQTGGEITRVQCAFLDTPEIERIMDFISGQRGYDSAYLLPDYVPEGEGGASEADLSRRDGLFEEAARLIVTEQQGSTSLIQRKFAIGYNRAGRIMDQLEAAGIVGRAQGSKPREVKTADLLHLEQMLESYDNR